MILLTEVPVRVISNEKSELMKLRDEVNKTLNRFEGLSEPAGITSIYPGAYERKLGMLSTLVPYF